MIENEQRKLPRVVGIPLEWVQHRWNEALYGFPQGRVRRIEMTALLGQDVLGLHGIERLLHLMNETHNSRLQVRMAEKVRQGVEQLVKGRSING